MGFVFRVRNVHVHQQGYAGELADDKGFALFLATLPGVGTQNNFIELKAGSCLTLLEIAEQFNDALLREYEAYRQRSQTLERLSRPPGHSE